MISCASDMNAMDELLDTNYKRYCCLDAEAAITICGIAGIDEKLIKVENKDGMEVVNVCKAWDDRKEAGRLEGIEIGKEEGKEEGIRAAINMCKNMEVTGQKVVENIAKAFSLPIETAEQKVSLYW